MPPCLTSCLSEHQILWTACGRRLLPSLSHICKYVWVSLMWCGKKASQVHVDVHSFSSGSGVGWCLVRVYGYVSWVACAHCWQLLTHLVRVYHRPSWATQDRLRWAFGMPGPQRVCISCIWRKIEYLFSTGTKGCGSHSSRWQVTRKYLLSTWRRLTRKVVFGGVLRTVFLVHINWHWFVWLFRTWARPQSTYRQTAVWVKQSFPERTLFVYHVELSQNCVL